jgi:hypothetical protein
VRQLNPRNPSGHFSHRSYFFNVTRKPKVPAPYRFFCVFVNLINMNLPHNRLWCCSDRNLDRFQNLHTSLYRIVIRVDDLQINRPFLGDLLCGKSLC